jgi:hypothetical protein
MMLTRSGKIKKKESILLFTPNHISFPIKHDMVNCHFVHDSIKSTNDRVIESYEAFYLSWFVDEHTRTHTHTYA